VVGELVVVAVIAEGSSALGKIAEIGFVLLVEESVLSGDAVGHRFNVLGAHGSNNGNQKEQAFVEAHGVCRVPDGDVVARRIARERLARLTA
jgi:hypothetical protein